MATTSTATRADSPAPKRMPRGHCEGSLRTAALAFVASALLMLRPDVAVAHFIDLSWSGPSPESPVAGDQVEVDVLAALNEAGVLISGALVLEFDSTVLRFVSAEFDPRISDPSDPAPSVDASRGEVSALSFAVGDMDGGLGGSFSLATFTFEALRTGTSDLVLSDPRDPVYAWQVLPEEGDDTEATPRFAQGSIRVRPVPLSPEQLAAVIAVISVLLADD